jgi:hypothetical protein
VLSVIETAADAQVESPRKNVVASAVPVASLAVATVPLERLLAFNVVKFAPLTAPKEPDHVPEVIVPVDVSEEPVTPEPRVVADRTSVPLILYVLPVAILNISEEVQPLAADQEIVLSVAPLRVIPPPTAVTSVGDAV